MKFLQKLGKSLMLPGSMSAYLWYPDGTWILDVSGYNAGWRN